MRVIALLLAACTDDASYARHDAAQWAGTWSDSLHTMVIEVCNPTTVAFTFNERVLIGNVDVTGYYIDPQERSWSGTLEVAGTDGLAVQLESVAGFAQSFLLTRVGDDDGQTDLCD